MGTPLVEGGYRAQLLFGGTATIRPWSTKFDYKGGVGHTLDDFASEFMDQLEDAYVAIGGSTTGIFAQGTVLQTVRIYQLEDPLAGVEATPIASWPAASTAGSSPGENCIVTSLRTAFLGRSYRGRQYWGSLNRINAFTSAGMVDPAAQNKLTTFVLAMNVVVGLTNYQHSVLRRTGPDVGTRYPAEAIPVTNVLCDDYPDTQRRRGAR
jgi:hypothetical protein